MNICSVKYFLHSTIFPHVHMQYWIVPPGGGGGWAEFRLVTVFLSSVLHLSVDWLLQPHPHNVPF